MSEGPSETLAAVENVARRLLAEEEVAAVVTTCRRVRSFSSHSYRSLCARENKKLYIRVLFLLLLQYVAEPSVEKLVRHLLVVLDRPEKLLLLREVR